MSSVFNVHKTICGVQPTATLCQFRCPATHSSTCHIVTCRSSSLSVPAVISSWQEHVPNPHAKPGPDFRAMNKAAADSGLTCSQQLRSFRSVVTGSRCRIRVSSTICNCSIQLLQLVLQRCTAGLLLSSSRRFTWQLPGQCLRAIGSLLQPKSPTEASDCDCVLAGLSIQRT